MKKTDYSFDIALFSCLLLLSLLHISAWSLHPTDVDPINFTVALQIYSPATDAPHPPGYPLFVFLARAAMTMVGAANAYQLANLILLCMSCVILYTIFRRRDKADLGLYVAVLTFSHPLALAATVTPECYISDMFFACGILFWTTQHDYRERLFLAGIFTLFLMLGLVRPVSGVMLMPLAIAGQFSKAWAVNPRKLFTVAIAIVFTGMFALLISYVITVYLAGGWDIYKSATQRVMGSAFNQNSILGGASPETHFRMLSHYIGWLTILSTPALFVVAYIFFKNSARAVISTHKYALALGASWILPPMAFYVLIYYLKPTYQLIYLPCLIIPIGWALSSSSGLVSKSVAKVVFLLITLTQVAYFFLPLPNLPQPLFRLTSEYVNQQDREWENLLINISEVQSNNTLIVWAGHPHLTIYSLRLINWNEPIGVFDQNSGTIRFLIPRSMSWIPPRPGDQRISDKYNSVLFIENRKGKSSIRLFPIEVNDSRELREILDN